MAAQSQMQRVLCRIAAIHFFGVSVGRNTAQRHGLKVHRPTLADMRHSCIDIAVSGQMAVRINTYRRLFRRLM